MGKGEIDKLEFMGLEFASLYGEYLEFAETNQPPLCKGISKHPNLGLWGYLIVSTNMEL